MKTWTINDIQTAMRRDGSHWWDRQSMRFFGTRVCGGAFNGAGGVYFVTSEQPPHGKRAYTIRQFKPDTLDVSTVGELCGYKTRPTALRHAEKLAQGDGQAVIERDEPHLPMSEDGQFLHDCQRHGNKGASLEACKILMRLGRQHSRMMTEYCNGTFDAYQGDDCEPHPDLAKCRDRIEHLATSDLGAKGVKFQGDPRGCTVKLIWNDGETNDFGKEGWCVPGA
jgi:hypothetical protein